jgi:hypothetical protein
MNGKLTVLILYHVHIFLVLLTKDHLMFLLVSLLDAGCSGVPDLSLSRFCSGCHLAFILSVYYVGQMVFYCTFANLSFCQLPLFYRGSVSFFCCADWKYHLVCCSSLFPKDKRTYLFLLAYRSCIALQFQLQLAIYRSVTVMLCSPW